MSENEFPVTLPRDRPIFNAPEWLIPETPAWIGHIPFAFWVIHAAQPSVLVELGTHYANSYFAFAQAMKSAELPFEAYAVDTWEGDEHSGFYGDEVFRAVSEHNAKHYAGFSTLVRSTFDDAALHFDPASIDLLHIDGHHTYESVREDFETWLPKLSPRAVVIFHDVKVREREFGVYRLWNELEREYPSFSFTHSHGLGVLGVGASQSETMASLFAAAEDPRATADVRDVFASLGGSLAAVATVEDLLSAARAELDLRVAEVREAAERETEELRNLAEQELDRFRSESDDRLATAEALLTAELEEQRLHYERQLAAADERVFLADRRAAARFDERLAEMARVPDTPQ